MSVTVLTPHVACVCTSSEVGNAVAEGYKQIYIITSKGIFLRQELRGGRIITMKRDSIPDYKEEVYTEDISAFMPGGKIPYEIYRQVEGFFRKVMEVGKTALEAMIFVMWTQEKGYFLWVPKQTVAAASARFDWDDKPEGSIIVNIHSHGSMNAFFSGTDDTDDATTICYSGVFGYLDKPKHVTTWRFNHYKHKIACTAEDIFQGLSLPAVEIPNEWLEAVSKTNSYQPSKWVYEGQGGAYGWERFPTSGKNKGGTSEGKNASQRSISFKEDEEDYLLNATGYAFRDFSGTPGSTISTVSTFNRPALTPTPSTKPSTPMAAALTSALSKDLEQKILAKVGHKYFYNQQQGHFVLKEGEQITAQDVKDITDIQKDIADHKEGTGNGKSGTLTLGKGLPIIQVESDDTGGETASIVINSASSTVPREVPMLPGAPETVTATGGPAVSSAISVSAPTLTAVAREVPPLTKTSKSVGTSTYTTAAGTDVSKKSQSTNGNDGVAIAIPTLVDEIEDLTAEKLEAYFTAQRISADEYDEAFAYLKEDPEPVGERIVFDGQYDVIAINHGVNVAMAYEAIDSNMAFLSNNDELLQTLMSDMLNLATLEGQGHIFKKLFDALPNETQEAIQMNGL